MEEIFKDIPNYEGRYQVSNLGRVKSLDRMITESNGKKRLLNGRVLKAVLNKIGYYQVNLRKDSKTKTRKVHQLVAEVFLNHIPCGHKLIVNHKNFIRHDNRLENLRLVTQAENNLNKVTENKSQYEGVKWSVPADKWMASITIGATYHFLDYFDLELEAAYAYKDALNKFSNFVLVGIK